MVNTTTLNETLRSVDGTESVRLATSGANWKATLSSIFSALSPVASVFGRTGAVVAASNDYTFAQLASKPTTLTGYGITSPLPVAQGGTAAATLTVHGILLGEGTSAIVPTAAMTNGQLLVGQTSSDPLPKTLSGDATLAASGALTLANSGVTATTYGDATHVGQFTVDAKGRLTSATSVAISGGGSPAGSSGQVQYNSSSAFAGANLWIEDADTVAKRNSTTAQNIYNYLTYTNSSNYERLSLTSSASGGTRHQISSEVAGSGGQRPISIVGGNDVEIVIGGSPLFSYGLTSEFDILFPLSSLGYVYRWFEGPGVTAINNDGTNTAHVSGLQLIGPSYRGGTDCSTDGLFLFTVFDVGGIAFNVYNSGDPRINFAFSDQRVAYFTPYGSGGVLHLLGSSSGETGIQAAATAGNWTLTLPSDAGTSGYSLTTDGFGATAWSNITAGSGGSPGGSLHDIQVNDGAGGFYGEPGDNFALYGGTLGGNEEFYYYAPTHQNCFVDIYGGSGAGDSYAALGSDDAIRFSYGGFFNLVGDYNLTNPLVWTFTGAVTIPPVAIASLPASPAAGMVASVNNALVPVIGSAVAGTGAAFALVCYNGSQWTVIGK